MNPSSVLTFAVGGGAPNYTVASSNPAVTATISAPVSGVATLTLTAAVSGASTIVVSDSAGSKIQLSAIVGTTASLFTNAASNVRLDVGGSATFAVGGGAPSYSVSSSAPAVATVAVTGPVSGVYTLTLTGVDNGTSVITITDVNGSKLSLSVDVGTQLYTNAPSAVSMSLTGGATTFRVGGGKTPYSVSSGNTSFVLASLGPVSSGVTTLTLTPVASGASPITVTDALGAKVSFTASVGGAPTLFTAAGSAITIPAANIGAATTSSFLIGGGNAPYSVTSSNTGVATVVVSNGATSNFTVTPLAVGTSNILVTDSAGSVVTIAFTVASANPLAVSPSSITASVGETVSFSVSGGTGSTYTLTSSNSSVASVPASTTAGSFTATLNAAGSSSITIKDTLGQSTVLLVTVNTAVQTMRLSPTAVAVGENYSGTIRFEVSGGDNTNTAYSSDNTIASVTPVGNVITVSGVAGAANNQYCISANITNVSTVNPGGQATLVKITKDVVITVVDSKGVMAFATITIYDNLLGGVGCL